MPLSGAHVVDGSLLKVVTRDNCVTCYMLDVTKVVMFGYMCVISYIMFQQIDKIEIEPSPNQAPQRG